MKGLDEFTKEESYAELAAQSAKVSCLQDEVDRLHQIVIKLIDKEKSTSSAKTDVRINL